MWKSNRCPVLTSQLTRPVQCPAPQSLSGCHPAACFSVCLFTLFAKPLPALRTSASACPLPPFSTAATLQSLQPSPPFCPACGGLHCSRSSSTCAHAFCPYPMCMLCPSASVFTGGSTCVSAPAAPDMLRSKRWPFVSKPLTN